MAERFAVGVVLCEDLEVRGLAKRWREWRGNRIYSATGAKDDSLLSGKAPSGTMLKNWLHMIIFHSFYRAD